MKLKDSLTLIFREYQYEKQEWALSVLLQLLLYSGILFLFITAQNMDTIFSSYLQPLYPNGFEFRLTGFTQADIPRLEAMGFYDISLYEERKEGVATIPELSGIWLYKLSALWHNKDIWNPDLDSILSVILFCQLIFMLIGIFLFIILTNHLANSIRMKLIDRTSYIHMLLALGCSERSCQMLYYGFFFLRSLPILLLSVGINAGLLAALNHFLTNRLYIAASCPLVSVNWTLQMGIYSFLLMWLAFRRQWRYIHE